VAAGCSPTADHGAQALPQAAQLDPIEALRSAAPTEDADGRPLGESLGVDPSRPVGRGNPPRQKRRAISPPRPSRLEIAQRLPLVQILENAGEKWGVRNSQTVNRYLNLARERMVEELITDRRRHQAEQIFALNECARRAMDAEQFSAAVGAFRVIAEIGGLLRAPIKPPEPRA
jgi:hypothetical protein